MGNKVDHISDSQLCCRFVAGFGNSRLCRQCVPGLIFTIRPATLKSTDYNVAMTFILINNNNNNNNANNNLQIQ